MAIDPVDDCTFWYTNKYYQRSKSRNTRIASFKFAPCNSSPPPFYLSKTSVIFPAQLGGDGQFPAARQPDQQSDHLLNISNMATTGEYGQTNDCGASLPASGSCTITITFTPTAMGTQTGSLRET